LPVATTAEDPFVLGVDLDGVCADYTLAFRDFVAADRGVEPQSLPMQRSWDFREWDLDAAEFERLHRAAVTEGRLLANLEPIEGASEALWRLSDAGVWIRIVTHRLYVNWGHAAAAGDTVSWLDSERIPYRDLCFMGAKTDVGAHAYIDDGPHNVDGLRAAGRTVIVFDQPYNQSCAAPRARNWGEAEDIVLDLMARHSGVAQTQLPGVDAGATRLDRHLGRSDPPQPPT